MLILWHFYGTLWLASDVLPHVAFGETKEICNCQVIEALLWGHFICRSNTDEYTILKSCSFWTDVKQQHVPLFMEFAGAETYSSQITRGLVNIK